MYESCWCTLAPLGPSLDAEWSILCTSCNIFHRVILFLNDIYKIGPNGIELKHFRLLYRFFLTIIFPLILDMGDNLNELKGDIFHDEKIVDREIPF